MKPRAGWIAASLLAVPLLVAALACAGAGGTPAATPIPAPAQTPPSTAARPTNLVVIVADDFGTDQLAAWGESPTPPPTPHLDRLVAEGVSFRNAYTSPVCSASRAALMTGRYGRRTGFGGLLDLAESRFELPLHELTLPEALKAANPAWSASAVGKWHLSGYRTPHAFHHPLDQGFDHHRGCLGNLVLSSHGDARGSYHHYERSVDGSPAWSDRYVTTEITDDALELVGSMREPWLLYVAHNAPHEPWQAPPPELSPLPAGADDAAKFAATIAVMDAEIGRLLDGLSDEVRARTTIVFLGDNGTDKDRVLPPFPREHGKLTMYEGGIGVPLVVAGAGVVNPGRSTDTLVHVVDLLPTLLDLVGAPLPDRPLDGISFAEVLRAQGPGRRRTVITERFTPLGPPPYELDTVAVRDARYKVIRGPKGAVQVFDLAGRLDDGPPLALAALDEPTRARVRGLVAELDRHRSVPFEPGKESE